MKEVGPGTYEIRVLAKQNWFRVFYVAKLKNAIYVLHAFEKKRNKTSAKDIKAAQDAYQKMLLIR